MFSTTDCFLDCFIHGQPSKKHITMKKRKRNINDLERESNPSLKDQIPKAEPGPGGSQESERMEYHEETSPKTPGKSYDHKPEKNLEE